MKTNISKTAGEHELQLQKNQSKWNISRICCHALEVKDLEFKSVFFLFSRGFFYELMLNSGDGGELQDLFVIYVILMLRICFGKTNFRDLKNAEMPCEDPYNRGRLKKIKSVFLYLLLYFILKIIEMNL